MEELRMIQKGLAPGIRKGRNSRSIHAKSAQGQQLQKMLKKLLKHGESSTVVIYGKPSSGKSSFVETILNLVSKTETREPNVVRLNGMKNQDLKSSIKEICFTLDLQNELMNFVTQQKNFDERLGDVLAFLRTSLVSASQLSPIIFILDHIELFCDHPGQALLYNLFDIVQAKTSPICVIGVTRAQDILELFEKRVKSRFSHRILHLDALTQDQFLDSAKELLSFACKKEWIEKVDDLLAQTPVKHILMALHAMDSTIYSLNCFLYRFVLSCDYELSQEKFQETYDDMILDSVVKTALTLTVLDLLMIKAIQKFSDHKHPTFNFNSLFRIVGRNSTLETLNATKADLLTAMLSLENAQLIVPLEKKSDRAHVLYRSEIHPHQYEQIFKKYPNLPTIFQTI